MKKKVKNKSLLCGKLIIGFFLISIFSVSIFADGNIDQGYIYGKIMMKNGTEYEGPLRWGKEEAFWGDMFNATKEGNDCLEYLSRSDLKNIRRNKSLGKKIQYFFSNMFKSRRRDKLINHQFVCRFGDIKKITSRSNRRVSLTLKNDSELNLKGGSNDTYNNINIIDKNEGKMELKWKRIKSIEFLPTPVDLKENFGTPLYGTVKTEAGNFKGFIQWDHEECLSTDILNGYSKNDKKLNIKFEDIESIKKYRDGSKVTLFSGKEYKMYDTNDVDDDNRGIVINDLILGKVMLEWDEFISVKFEKNPEVSIPAYTDYVNNKKLFGKVKTRGMGDLEGRIIFDLDETFDNEMLDGVCDDIQYYVPLRSIKTLIPRGAYSKLVLTDGRKLELEDGRDVSRDNDGLLVWDKNKEKPTYIPWRKVKEISFQ